MDIQKLLLTILLISVVYGRVSIVYVFRKEVIRMPVLSSHTTELV